MSIRKRVQVDDLTDAQGAALSKYARNRVSELELEEASRSAHASVEELVQLSMKGTREERDAHARAWIKMVDAAHRVGRLQEPALFLLRVRAVEKIHEDRLVRDDCGPELAEVDARLERVRLEHGLTEHEYWSIGEGPREWEELNHTHDAICQRLFVRALREFGLNEEAALLERDPPAFEARRELGRRAVVEGLSDLELLESFRDQFLMEARKSASVGAYHAAAAMIGGAMEALMIARCVRSKDEAIAAAQRLSRKKRPKSSDPRTWKFAELCLAAEQAGWLPEFEIVGLKLTGERLAEMVRELRNMVHPEKLLRMTREHPHGVFVMRFHYDDALAAYELLERYIRE